MAKEPNVSAFVRSGFLGADGEHVEAGSTVELEYGFFRMLETTGKVMRSEATEESAAKPSKSKGNA